MPDAAYVEAYNKAREAANEFNRPMGLERAIEYGCTVYRIKWIPVNPQKRVGWELRCQVVEPGEPQL